MLSHEPPDPDDVPVKPEKDDKDDDKDDKDDDEKNAKDIWSQVTKLEDLCQANAPLFFAIVRAACDKDPNLAQSKEVTAFFAEIVKSSAINQVTQLIEAPVLTHDRFKPN